MINRVLQHISVVILLLFVHTLVMAAPITARLDRNSAVVGETVTLILKTSDTDQSLDTDLGVLQTDFDVLNRRTETQMSFVNGRQTASVQLVVTLEPRHAGNLLIPALKFPGASSPPLRLKVSAAPALAPGEPEPVFIELLLEPESGPYYVHSQLGLIVRIFYQSNLTEAAINPPAPTQASVRLLDEVPYQAERSGNRYRVLERRYAIFPERSGTLTIPPMQLSGRLIERPSDRLWQPTVRGRRLKVESDPLNLEIRPRPVEFTGDYWLPARRITLSQQISDSGKLHVGEPVTRTVIMDAVGLEENMLEEPRWPEVPNVRIYPDQPQGISRDDGEWVLGHKEFRYAVVPEQPGSLVLPEIRLDWWDTVSQKQQTATLPAHTLEVLPSELNLTPGVLPPAVSPVSTIDSAVLNGGVVVSGDAVLWKSTTGVFFILWLLTLYALYRRGQTTVLSENGNEPDLLAEKDLLKHFRRTCQNGDATNARRQLSQWVRHYAPLNMRGSMGDFALLSDDRDLHQAIKELDVTGFSGGDSGPWDGEVLWASFKRWQDNIASSKKTSLAEQPNLYAEAP